MGWDIRTGANTEPELDLIRYAVREGETAIDIGANYGLYSYHLSRALGPRGKVYAFEPIPFTAGSFRHIARALRFHGVELIEKGCGEQAGVIEFTVPIQDSGAIIAGVVHMGARDNERPGRERHARFQRTKKIPCEVIVLDERLPGVRDVSFVKCDIEGADLYALRGARKLLERNKPVVVCEINPWFLEGFGLKVEDLVGYFESMGYGLYRFVDARARAS
jgi:FkbM family methyltransferase